MNENQRLQIINLEREKELRETKDKVSNLYDKVIKLEREKNYKKIKDMII